MGIFKSLAGMVTLELTSADLAGSLSAVNELGIPVFDVHTTGELSAQMRVYRRDCKIIRKLAQRKGDRIQVLRRHGIYWNIKGLFRRPVFLSGMTLLLCLALYLPGRVLFVRVEGNETIPDNLILEAAEKSGISFGASRREVRSEKVKNTLLGAVPELQWAGVNTYGCVAVISVRERAAVQKSETAEPVSSIVAARDGIILSVTVMKGNGICTVGQAVQEGDVLISGFTDCGLCITASHAEGEVFAQTHRSLTVKTPDETAVRTEKQGMKKKYSLIIGKKRINFYKGSGICDGTCVKMYTEYCLTLPGGFRLPVTLVQETVVTYAAETAPVTQTQAAEELTDFASAYLCSQMVAGTVIDRTETVLSADGAWCLAGEYACTEMIGRVQTEEIGVLP